MGRSSRAKGGCQLWKKFQGITEQESEKKKKKKSKTKSRFHSRQRGFFRTANETTHRKAAGGGGHGGKRFFKT